MQVTQTAADGLKRKFKVVVPADEIESRVKSRLERLSKTVRVPGFRPGRAPLGLLRRQYGRAVMGEVLEEAVDQGSRQAIDDNSLRPALRPKVEVTAFDEGKDLEFNLGVEVLPDVPEIDLTRITLTRLVAEPDEERVDQAVANLVRARTSYTPIGEPRAALPGDQLVIDFEGTVDGVSFEGGRGEGMTVVLGSRTMLPGFEDGLIGAEVGVEREIVARFPDSYGRAELAGKEARFKVLVKEIRAAEPITVDDAWAQSLGFEDLADLRRTFRDRIANDLKAMARNRLKRELLDQLAAAYRFEVPPGMVDIEFESIWKQLSEEMRRSGESFGEGAQSEEALRAEYRAIAERRVRLGLLLADIGAKNDVQVQPQELQQAMIAHAQRFPGQERQVFEFLQKTPAALEQLRAPIYEDKVVDLILGRANVTERSVSVEELLRDPDEPAASTPGEEA
jgi:trigger factor